MAAANTDKFKKSKRKFETTVGIGGILAGGTTLPLTSVTGLDTSTAVTLVIGAGTATEEVVTGVVSGSDLINCVRGKEGTTDSAHSAGETVNMFFTETHWDDAMDGILVDHDQSGQHKNLTDANGNEWIKQTATASAVNELTVANAATTKPVTLSATGGDTNVSLHLNGKGTGKVSADSYAEIANDFVQSGMVWSGDSYGSTLAASMTAGVCYINGRRINIAAVTARAFTASKDTYVDILDNADGTGTVVYTEATNNAASSALAANSLRIAIIVTGAGNIAAATSINQGQETKVLPIASSIPYQVTDSLGNLICPRDPNRKVLGYRQILSDFSTASSTSVQVTGLTVPVIVPTGRKVRITVSVKDTSNSTAGGQVQLSVWDGVVASGTQITEVSNVSTSPSYIFVGLSRSVVVTPSTNSKTYNVGLKAVGGGTSVIGASSTAPAVLIVELV